MCCGWRKKEGRGRNRSKNDGWGSGRRIEGVEEEARVMFEGVAMVKYAMKFPGDASQSNLVKGATAAPKAKFEFDCGTVRRTETSYAWSATSGGRRASP